MDLVLNRKQFREDGIFGELRNQVGDLIAVTLEHAFPAAGGYAPVIPQGTYDCVRGEHYLHGMTEPFTTFEVSGVDGHAGLLFHWGNFNRDSEGCILLGDSIRAPDQSAWMVTDSRVAFEKFMSSQDGLLFRLLVID